MEAINNRNDFFRMLIYLFEILYVFGENLTFVLNLLAKCSDLLARASIDASIAFGRAVVNALLGR